MSTGASDASGSGSGRGSEGERLGGARADFVASLGRKVSDTRGLLSVLDDDPSSKLARDELRRRLHALCSGARLLRFEAMAHSLQEALAVLDRAAQLGELGEAEIAFTAQVLDDLPALAWGEGAPRDRLTRPVGDAQGARSLLPIAIVVVGDEALADALTEEGAIRARSVECERTEDVDTALQLARQYAPDLLVVDADRPRVSDLVEALLDDPLTEPVPIVVVGTFRLTDEAARFTALGVAKTFVKPVASAALRAACDEILDAREGRTLRMTLGEPTLEQLASRLAEELKRALVDSVDAPARSIRVPLGEGTEVLGALWGAIARIQEIVAQRTAGAIRFGGDAPEGAIALAPWLHQDVSGSDRGGNRGRGAAADVRMTGRRVVVADDDPGVTWFISDLLRTAGCEVYEALDGTTALELAYRMQPELVVSDILMPGLDGFALSRALRRDVALRDTPVILLSWKEDLLQRVRELGASAAAYMRKETDSRAILARVREVLRPRARIEMRMRGAGEVRGRLDELSPRLLLELVCVVRKDARVAVRDASFLYEIDIRGGAPRKVTRTASDGGYQNGERALASLLGVGAGRFVISKATDSVRGDLVGTLFEQLASPIASARGAAVAVSGASAMRVDRILFDRASLDPYLRATPDPARALIRRIADGASPRQILLGGDVSPSLLEDVLADLAARGAIRAVESADGEDLLTPAVEAALAIVRGVTPRSQPRLPPNARPSVPALEAAVVARRSDPPPVAPVYETLTLSEPPPRPVFDDDDGVPSSLEDAVMRELSERSPYPGPAHAIAPQLPPIIEPSELRPRSSNPPADAPAEDESPLPSIPPDAIVPDAASGRFGLGAGPPADPAPAAETPLESTAPAEIPTPAGDAPDPVVSAEGPFVSPFGTVTAPVDETTDADARVSASKDAADASIPIDLKTVEAKAIEPAAALATAAEPKAEASAIEPPATEVKAAIVGARPAHPSQRPGSIPPARSPFPWGLLAAFLVLAAAVGAAIHFAETEVDPAPGSAVPAVPAPVPAGAASASASPAIARPSAPASGDPLPPGIDVPAGSGYLEVSAPPGANVRVDGALIGTGPSAARVVAAGYHEVAVEQGGHESSQVVEVRDAKTTRVRSAALP